ncbi:phosphatidylserine decarboxylase [Leptothoe sp. EHU-05/26/07-4]
MSAVYPPLTEKMKQLIAELRDIVSNPVVEAAYNDAIANVTPLIEPTGERNPWIGQTIDYFVEYFEQWFTFLPQPNGGLGKIVPFTYFYRNNETAFFFLNQLKSRRDNAPYTTEIFNWTVKFILARGEFMDSPESKQYIKEWEAAPATQIQDFIIPKGGYQSFNQFFTRELNPEVNARPIAAYDDDSILVAPADSEINFIESDLTLTTDLRVKTREINVFELLNKSQYAQHFVGGTAVSCVLMPNNYHRFHSPVTGNIVESMDIPGIYNGITDGEHWFNHFNVGESTTNFSVFEDFHRAYYIIETKKYGYVALIPVGLNTISSISASLVNNQSTMVPPGSCPVAVKKGDELGHFAYGGSLNILLFQSGVFNAISVLMGQRLGSLSSVSN